MSIGKHIVAHDWNPVRLIFKFGGFIAWTSFWGTVYYKDKKYMTPRTIRHEECHLAQYKRLGRLRFAYEYIMETLENGYWDNRFEVEARRAETHI